MLNSIITSVSRQKILSYFFSGGVDFSPYVRQIVRDLNLEINAVRRELENLQNEKIIISEARGNRLHYVLNSSHPLYYNLAAIVAKSSGLGSIIYKKRKKLGNIKFALLSLGFFLKSKKNPTSIDLLIVGDVYINVVKPIIEKFEKLNNLEVNYMVLNLNEYELLKDRRDNVLTTCLISPRCVLIGSEEKFLS